MRLLCNIQPVAPFSSFLGEVLHYAPEEQLRLKQLKAILLRTSLHPSKVKQAFDQAIQPRACAAKAFVVLLPTRLAWHSAISQHFAELTKRGQWCPKFVRHSRHEVGLETRDFQLACHRLRDKVTAHQYEREQRNERQ